MADDGTSLIAASSDIVVDHGAYNAAVPIDLSYLDESPTKRIKLDSTTGRTTARGYPNTRVYRTAMTDRPRIKPSAISPLTPRTASRINARPPQRIARKLFHNPQPSRPASAVLESKAEPLGANVAVKSKENQVKSKQIQVQSKGRSANIKEPIHGDSKEKLQHKAAASPAPNKFWEVRAIIAETAQAYVVDWEDEADGTQYEPTLEPKQNVNREARQDWTARKQAARRCEIEGGGDTLTGEREWDVANIVDHMSLGGMSFYKVAWKTMAGEPEQITWEPESHFSKDVLRWFFGDG